MVEIADRQGKSISGVGGGPQNVAESGLPVGVPFITRDPKFEMPDGNSCLGSEVLTWPSAPCCSPRTGDRACVAPPGSSPRSPGAKRRAGHRGESGDLRSNLLTLRKFYLPPALLGNNNPVQDFRLIKPRSTHPDVLQSELAFDLELGDDRKFDLGTDQKQVVELKRQFKTQFNIEIFSCHFVHARQATL